MSSITTIAFDADDTLWHNENLFDENHRKYCDLLAEFHDAKTVEKTLFKTEMRNLELYGYGIKSFMLSSIETAIELTEGAISGDELKRIIHYGQHMLSHPVDLLDGVAEVVQALAKEYRLLIITKGDLRDQERKVAKSDIAHCFEHVEIVSEKNVETYDKIFRRHNINTSELVMIGNSIKSDILPVLDLGGFAVHIPYHLTWEHEKTSTQPQRSGRFFEIESIQQLPELIERLSTE